VFSSSADLLGMGLYVNSYSTDCLGMGMNVCSIVVTRLLSTPLSPHL